METLRQLQQNLPSLAFDAIKLGIWLVLLALIFVPLERCCGVRSQKIFRRSFATDIGYYFLNSLLLKFLLALPLSLIAMGLHRAAPAALYAWVAHMPLPMRFAAAMLVGEIGAYWGHRWSHQVPALWRFHAIHHSAEEMDWLVNTRAHPLDMVFTRLCALVPVYLLGLAQPGGQGLDVLPMLMVLLGTVWSFFIHANLRWRFGPLEMLVTTPAFHHWHHGSDGSPSGNKNYAALLPLVDKLFGTLHLPSEHAPQWPSRYGIDVPLAPGLAGQLWQPFERRPGTHEGG